MKKLLLALSICVASVAYAQNNEGNAEVKRKLIQSYFALTVNETALFSGKEQIKYSKIIKDHPYLDTDEYRDGYLSYNGIEYPKVKIRIDLYKNELIVQPPNQMYNIIIPHEMISHIVLDNKYIFYNKPKEAKNSLPSGYLIELHDGKYRVLKKESITLFEQLKDREMDARFIRSKKYYVLKENQYYTVRNKSSVLKLFKDRKKELNAFIKREKLDFKHNTDVAIVAVVSEYEKQSK